MRFPVRIMRQGKSPIGAIFLDEPYSQDNYPGFFLLSPLLPSCFIDYDDDNVDEDYDDHNCNLTTSNSILINAAGILESTNGFIP